MRIPKYYTDFITKREIYGYIASLNSSGYCDMTRTCGIYPVNEDHLKIIFMSGLSTNLIRNLADNPKISLNGISAYTFESYQIKGSYISHENLSADDIMVKENYLKGMLELIAEMKFGIDEKSLDKYCQSEATAIIMKVEEIYEQTPKQGTGEKIKVETVK